MVRLSASSIKSYESCSWVYFCEKVLKFPRTTHPKTSAGSIAHKFFEVLSNPRHNHYVKNILSEKTISGFLALERLLYKLIKAEGLLTKDWFEDIDGLILAGLELDFEQEGSTYKYKPEYEFLIKSLTGKYEIRGFIDRVALREGRVTVRDFKSQGIAFTEEELEYNIQALIYQYAMHKETGLPVDVEFVMLRHDKIQKVDWPGEDTMEGFENYLEGLADYFTNFGMEKACSNFAAHDKSKWYKLGCITKEGQIKKNGQPFHLCSYKFPRTIYYVKDKDKKVLYSVDDPAKIKLKDGEVIEPYQYGGCKYYFKENYE